MEFHQWQQQLREALRSQRVSHSYSERLLDELESHYYDMQEAGHMHEAINSGAILDRLGDPKALASQAAVVPYPTWTGRHPWLGIIFGAPMVALVTTLLLSVLVALALIPVASGRTLQTDPWLGPLMAVLGPLQVMAPGLFASLLVCRSTDRSGRSPRWGIAACGLIALFCALSVVKWSPAVIAPGTGSLSLGMAFPIGATWYQAIVPTLVGVFYWVRSSRPQRPTSGGTTATQVPAAA